MILMGFSTQAHIIDVSLHFSPAGNQFLHQGSLPQDILDFIYHLLKKSRNIRDNEGHDLQAEDTALRRYKAEQLLSP